MRMWRKAILLVSALAAASCGSTGKTASLPTTTGQSLTSTTVADYVHTVKDVFDTFSQAYAKLPPAETHPTYIQVKDAAGPLATACVAARHELDSVTWPPTTVKDEAMLYAALQTLETVINGNDATFHTQFVPDTDQVISATKALLADLGVQLNT